jgi:hypothetical protein
MYFSECLERRIEMFGTANKFVISIVLISFVTGCTTMRPLPAADAQSIASHIEVGDKVQIIRNDASDVKFKVETISDEGLEGGGIVVAYSDILQISVREHSTAKTVGLIAAILIVVKGMYDYADATGSTLGGL